MNLLSDILEMVIRACYSVTENYALAIVIFTLLTKVILFPVSLWTQRNSIRMVALTPDLNALKIQHYGDKDAIAEETQALYKQKHYNPLASTIPMFIQLVLLIGVIGAVRNLLSGTGSTLSVFPYQTGGVTILVPLGAGLAALALGLAQNHLNPLQKEQTSASQWATNGFSIAISLALGAFVPVGVGLYWICSNLFTIVQQAVLNVVLPSKKYVDYVALEKSKAELASMDQLSAGISKEDKQREKADYKRFFSVANKHLVFYSEKSGFYKYFQDVIEYLLAHSNVIINYVTSDPKDQIFKIAEKEPHIRPYYIGEKRLITLMMKMDADMVVMTMPDIDNFHIKRSYVRKDIEYVYIFHGVVSGLRTLRPGALDNYDTILMPGDYIENEIRQIEAENSLPAKKLVPCGYCVIDNMARAYEKMPKQKGNKEGQHVLIAPSWQEDNILDSCLTQLIQALLDEGFIITVRPHPQYLKRFPIKFEAVVKKCEAFPPGKVIIEKDFSSNVTVFTADLIVTDWSSIGYEYSFATNRPVMYIHTPMKVVNPQCENWDSFDLQMRRMSGIDLLPEEITEKAGAAAKDLIENRAQYEAAIRGLRDQHLYHFGESGKYGAQYILHALQEKQKSKEVI